MSMIDVNNLTFCYEQSYDDIFTNVSFQIDTDWKLGFTGRNGRGKTTFLNLLLGRYEYRGSITTSVEFDYFPCEVADITLPALAVIKESIADFNGMETRMESLLAENTEESLLAYSALLEQYQYHDGYVIEEYIKRELARLEVHEEVLDRPFQTLSNGERTKVLLAALFLKKNNFLLIDEPTNHLDAHAREIVAQYLQSKKSFILVSHDRQFLDSIVDHILVINRANIEVQRGNFSSWQENKSRQDQNELSQNEKLQKEIVKLTQAVKRTAGWSDKVEKSKNAPLASGLSADKGYIGHQSAKMMKRSKAIQARQERSIEEKKSLLKNIEYENTLSISPLPFQGKYLAEAVDLAVNYGGRPLFDALSFTVSQGERVQLKGKNGCGKSSIIKLLAGNTSRTEKNIYEETIPHTGLLKAASGLVISYVSQDTSHLKGGLSDYAFARQIDESLFKTILIKLDFSRIQFEKDIEDYSEGQKKKVLLAQSLSRQAHLYLWDEPLNFIDVLSRRQIEDLLLKCAPTMVFVEHDRLFSERIATKVIEL